MDPIQGFAALHLAAIVESSDDAIVSKTLDGIVTSWNSAAERLFGFTAEEMIGQSIRRIIPADRQTEEDDVIAHIRRGEKVAHFETVRQRKDGSAVTISLTVSPIHDARGVVVGASKVARDISDRKAEERERARLLNLAERSAAITATLNDVGAIVASALDRETVVQAVTDAGTQLTGAQFGAFFYNVTDERGESYTLYTISGVSRDKFSRFPMPRNTAVFDPTFRGASIVRSSDITKDPRYGKSAPYFGMPPGHLPVRSYLAVPVKGRSGDVLGGLFFGHGDADRFNEEHERLAIGIASWASVALENSRLYVAAQQASQLKDEFLATLSHELRTPLNAILGYARMMRSGLLPSERQSHAVETIERNATSLTLIVEDVLDVSRIISGKMRVDFRAVDLCEVVRESVDAVTPGAESKGVVFDLDCDPQAGLVSGDPQRLQQVVWNLLSNAVKFTGPGGRVSVRLVRKGPLSELTVSDTGIGIPPAFLPHIFERFRQADASPTRERGGLGLGLAISRQLVELHGGTITGASAGPDQGSTFTVTLPYRSVSAAGAGAGRGQARGERSANELSGLTVLAVDDDPDALAMVRDILEASDAVVSTSRSAAEALALLKDLRPDVLLCDLGMPDVDGFQLLDQVRRSSDPAVRDLPAAALTAYARSEDRLKALRTGFQLHLAKPIEPRELVAAVASLGSRRPTSG